jgi:hypothetical protein
METVNVGHTVACSIVYLDANGQPMLEGWAAPQVLTSVSIAATVQ